MGKEEGENKEHKEGAVCHNRGYEYVTTWNEKHKINKAMAETKEQAHEHDDWQINEQAGRKRM